MTEKEKLRELLKKLTQSIHSAVNDGLAKKALKPQYLPYFKWKLTKFEYGESGVVKSAKGDEFLKPYWGRAAWLVYERVKKLNVYTDTLTAITKVYVEEFFYESHLQTLIIRIAQNVLQGKIKTPIDSAKYITSFLKDLDGESQEYRAEVQLKGLLLQPRSIRLDNSVRLRRPNRKDFEREVPISFPTRGIVPLEDPTAFLHTRIYARADTGVGSAPFPAFQYEIDREVAALRLFRLGGVQDIQYTTSTDSIIRLTAGTLTRGRLLGGDKYLITKEDVKPLKTFWANIKEVKLPSSVYPGNQKEPDELSIAYDRYSDSLEGGIIEKRISSAVMGLEALYLSPSEQQEMSYRLRMRVGKLLSLIGYNHEEVRKNMTDAYDVRSTYVHGGILKQKDRRKLKESYGGINELTKIIMDYLRASIVALLKRPNKETLIQKIDDSFLDSEKDEEVKKLLFMPYEKEV